LFRKNERIKKEWGETTVGRTRVDGLLSILDEEGILTMFSVVELSGPWYTTNNNHFLKDKNKIAKNLKLILNYIYKMNKNAGSKIKHVKVYGLQAYKKTFYVYSLQSMHPKLYLFKKEEQFDYPTSPSYFQSQLIPFIKNLLLFKSLVESSVENILQFLNTNQTDNSEQNFIDSTDNSPIKKKERL
jgi:hypothetical protein